MVCAERMKEITVIPDPEDVERIVKRPMTKRVTSVQPQYGVEQMPKVGDECLCEVCNNKVKVFEDGTDAHDREMR